MMRISTISKLPNWTLRIKELSSEGQWQKVLIQYHQLTKSGLHVEEPSLFPAIFKACTNLLHFNHGTSLHSSIIKQGLESFTSISNSIIDFYMKCGTLSSAMNAFASMEFKDSITWNVMIHGCLSRGNFEDGLCLFVQARAAGFEPNVSTLVLVLQACRVLKAIPEGLGIHGFVVRSGFLGMSSVHNSLLSFYVETGEMAFAKQMFDEMPERDVISWSAILGAYVKSGEGRVAFQLFREMFAVNGVEPDELTVVSIINACTKLRDVYAGRSLHGYVIRRGFTFDTFVGNSLVDMYSKCVDADSALKYFDEMPRRNIVSWNSVLSGLVYNGCYLEAMTLFASMDKDGFEADEVTMVTLLQVCKNLVDPMQCKSIHDRIIRQGFEGNDVVNNTLMDSYAKCNLVEFSWKVFQEMEKRDMISWSTMIAAFSQCGRPDDALFLFHEMTVLQKRFNSVTMLSLLESCSLIADLRRSKWAHGLAIRNGMAAEVAVETALLDMYSKCGAINFSRKVFDQMQEKNIVSWSALISAYGLNGRAHDALSLLEEMDLQGIKPNAVTMVSVLVACNHGGLTEEGRSCFERMVRDHGLEPGMEHYSCMVDMLGRSGDLISAMAMIERMPAGIKVGASVWGALLSACRDFGNNELGGRAVSNVLELEPFSSSGYLLACSIYAARGLWNEVARMRLMAKEKGVRVTAGYSLVHVENKAHRFIARDGSHPKSEEIYAIVELLHSCIKVDRRNDVLTTQRWTLYMGWE